MPTTKGQLRTWAEWADPDTQTETAEKPNAPQPLRYSYDVFFMQRRDYFPP